MENICKKICSKCNETVDNFFKGKRCKKCVYEYNNNLRKSKVHKPRGNYKKHTRCRKKTFYNINIDKLTEDLKLNLLIDDILNNIKNKKYS